jgi:nucleoid DNA-binding protein
MNKQEIVTAIATKIGGTKVEAEQYLTAVLETIEDAVKAGVDFNLVGYLKISVKARAARVARNVKTGEPVQVPAKNVVKAKVSPALSRLAN